MKQVVWKGKVNGKIVRGSFFCGEERPNRAQTIAERTTEGYPIQFFRFVVRDFKVTMEKVAEV